MHLSWAVLLPLALASICPMENHQVCNADSEEHKCVCAVSALDENSVPEQSCNNLIDDQDDEDFTFSAVSVEFNLDENDGHDDFPEDQFKETIATSLRVEEDDIIILRASCEGTEDKLIVQFAILNKDNNETEMPFEEDDFIDVKTIVTRLKAMGHLDKIADLDVEEIKYVEELIDIEFEPDNTELIVQAAFVGAGFFLMFALGIYMCIRGQGYSDELQKA